MLLFHHAQLGSICGMEDALKKGANINSCFNLVGSSALHFAASCSGRVGTDAVRWLLEKGIGWYKTDENGLTEAEVAKAHGNEESSMVLRECYVHSGKDDLHWRREARHLHGMQNTSCIIRRSEAMTIRTTAIHSRRCAWITKAITNISAGLPWLIPGHSVLQMTRSR
jgi:hypothetical protein